MQKTTMGLIVILTTALMMAWAVPALAADDSGQVNINTASKDELMTLEGIGESYADRIIEFREKNGPFQNPEDILKVKGIGEKTYEMNMDRIVVKSE